MRRLPVYLLLDVSGSMRGEPIEAVNQGIRSLVDTLMTDPYALETVFMSIIAFNNTVEETVPLTELYKFNPPVLEAKLGTYLGKALKFLSEKVDTDVVKTTANAKGDWKPIAFIMTDGRSGDKVQKVLPNFDKLRFSCIVVCAFGDDPRLDTLLELTPNIIRLTETDAESIKSFFKWVSASVATSSMRVEESNHEVSALDELPPLPQHIKMVKS